jgi:hypothetical protein
VSRGHGASLGAVYSVRRSRLERSSRDLVRGAARSAGRVALAIPLAIALALLGVGAALGIDHTALPTPILIDPLDPRAGEGASMVGAPLLAALVVVGLGIAAAAGTAAYLRLTRGR